jgi:hypothetical protein
LRALVANTSKTTKPPLRSRPMTTLAVKSFFSPVRLAQPHEDATSNKSSELIWSMVAQTFNPPIQILDVDQVRRPARHFLDVGQFPIGNQFAHCLVRHSQISAAVIDVEQTRWNLGAPLDPAHSVTLDKRQSRYRNFSQPCEPSRTNSVTLARRSWSGLWPTFISVACPFAAAASLADHAIAHRSVVLEFS